MKMKSRCLTWLFLSCLAPIPLYARTIIGVTTSNQLIQFDHTTPGTLSPAITVTGLSGDTIQAIDFRPATGVLYAIATNGTNGRIYTINTSTAVATLVGSAPFSTTLTNGGTYGMDFDPVSGLIRVSTFDEKNLRLNPDDGTLVAMDTNLNPNVGSIQGLGYDRNDRNPATATTLFGIDFISDNFVRIGGIDGNPSPDLGVVTIIGPTGITTIGGSLIGLDIADDGVAFASMAINVMGSASYRLYTMNVGSGAATLVGTIGTGATGIRGIAVVPHLITNIDTGENFGTIQAAINDAQTLSGHTIVVNAGTFAELVTVSKSVTLLGARAGVDARSSLRGTQESVVRGANPAGGRTSAFRITASDVVIDGFTTQEAVNTTQFSAASIFMDPSLGGTRIRNNIIQSNSNGIYLSNNALQKQAVIERNLFTGNNGIAVYSDQVISGGTLINVLIDNNTFSTNDAGVDLQSNTAASQSRIVISNNIFNANGNGILFYNTTDSLVTRNQITGSGASQVVLAGGATGVTFTENLVSGGSGRGIRVVDVLGGSPNAGFVATCNSIHDNALAGLEIDPGPSYTGQLDATGNWWGSASGPTIASNPGGTGEEILDPNTQIICGIL